MGQEGCWRQAREQGPRANHFLITAYSAFFPFFFSFGLSNSQGPPKIHGASYSLQFTHLGTDPCTRPGCCGNCRNWSSSLQLGSPRRPPSLMTPKPHLVEMAPGQALPTPPWIPSMPHLVEMVPGWTLPTPPWIPPKPHPVDRVPGWTLPSPPCTPPSHTQ